MSTDQMERRVEDLESEVATLKEALESVLEWTMRTQPDGDGDPSRNVIIGGQGKTQEILDRMP